MARTPDRRPGESDEEGIVLENRSSGDNPTVAGGIRYVAGAFKFKDAIGIFDPRFPPAGGSNSEVQFNDSGVISGSSLFTFNKSVGTVSASSFFSRNFFETNGYLRFNRPTQAVPTLPVDSAFIYMSGSTNDLVFSHYDNSKSAISSVRLNWLESNLSTGLLHGGLLSTENGTTTFSITSGSGFIVSYNASVATDPDPIVTYVTWPTYVSQSLPFSGSAQITYIAIDLTGSILQQITPYSTLVDADVIPVGRILHQSGSVTNGSISTPNVAYGLTHWHDDFTRLWGPLKVSGHVLSPSGSNLTLKKTGGVSYAVGRNYQVDPNNPNQVADPATTVSKIYREYTSGSTYIIDTGVANAGYTDIDPTQYNNNGTLSAVAGGTDWSIQRVFWFPNSVNKAFFVYYGENVYSTQADALNAISTETFTEGNNTDGAAIFVAYIVVRKNCTNLSDPTQAKIIQASISRGTSAGGSGGSSGGGTTTPGGADTYVQFNDGGTFGGDAQFTYNKTTDTLTIGNVSIGDTGNLSTTSLVANLFNTNATTVNLAGAATTLNVGNVAGTNNISGVVKAPQGFSGSLTKLTDGTSYLIAGAGISVTTGSNGAITITNDGTVGDITAVNAGQGLLGGGTSGAVSLAIDDSIVATVSGTTFTGATKHNAGLSGSLTQLTDGTSYLIAGTNIGISTGSNGSVTISNTTPIFYQWNELSPAPRLNTTASVSIAGDLGSSYAAQSSGSDVFFFVSGSIGTTSGVSVFGGDLVVSGTLETQTITNISTVSLTSPLTLNGSSRGTNNAGRGISLLGAPGGGGVGGGNILIDAGDGTGSSSSGGSITIDAGNTTTVAAAGSVTIAGGTTTSTGGTAQAGSVTITGGNLPSGGPGTAGSISLTTGNAANVNATPGNITLTAQRGKVILKPTTAAAPVGTDTFLYVSGTIGDSDRSVFAGDVVISGSLRVFTGISGSLTSSNVAAGQIVVAGPGGVLSGSNNFWWDNTNRNVGIGTSGGFNDISGTESTLHIANGNLASLYLNSTVNGRKWSISSAASGNFLVRDNTGSAWRMIIDPTGNVGIGSGLTVTSRLLVSGSTGDSSASAMHLVNASGTSLLFVRNDGNIGIGSTSPGAVLDVNAGANGRFRFAAGGTSAISDIDNFTFRSSNTFTTFMTLNGTGLGIGASPTSRLFVSGGINASTPTMVVKEGYASPLGGVGTFDVQNSAGTSLLFVSGSGNVGINTAAPAYKLDVHGDVRFARSGAPTQHILFQSNAGANYIRGISASGNAKNLWIASDSNSGGIVLQTEASGTPVRVIPGNTTTANFYQTLTELSSSVEPGTDVLYDLGSSSKRWRNLYANSISGSLTGSNVTAGQVVVAGTGGVLSGSNNFWWDNTNGRVGIGTSSPQKNLEVITSASDYASVGVTGLGTNQWTGIHFGYREPNTNYRKSAIVFERIDSAARGKIHVLNNHSFNASSATLSDARLTISSSGDIGIGGTNPTARLEVTGSTGDSSAATLHLINLSGASIFYARNDQYIGVGTSTLTSGRSITTAADIEVYGVRLGRGGGAGSTNTAVGAGALDAAGSKSWVTAVGYQAGNSLGANANGNTLIGYQAGSYYTGGGLATTNTLGVLIGDSATFFANGTSNEIVIGRSAVGIGSNSTVIGNSSTVLTYLAGNVGVGTTSFTGRLYISGSSTGTTTTLLARHGVAEGSNLPVLDVQNSVGASLLFVSGSGNVGIGVNAPSYRLQVRGNTTSSNPVFNLSVTRQNSNTAALLLGADGSNNAAIAVNGDLGLLFGKEIGGTSWTEFARFNSSGQLGIGTNNPNGNRLAISGGNLSVTGSVLPGPNAASNGYDLGSTTYRWRDLYARSGSFTGDVTIAGDLTVNGTQFIVNTQVVEIEDNAILLNAGPSPANTGGIYVADTATGVTGSLIWDTVTDQWKAGRLGSETTLVSGSGATNYISKWSGTNGLGNSVIYDDGTNVGINTTTVASYRLNINAGNQNPLHMYTDNGTATAVRMSQAGQETWFLSIPASTSDFSISSAAGAVTRFTTSGNVGIGTATVTARLLVTGSSTASTPTMIIREGVVSPTGGVGILNVQNSAGTSILFVSGSSRVGINTTTPVTDFSLRGSFAAHSAFGTYTNMAWMGQFYYTAQQRGVAFSYTDGTGGNVIQGLSGAGNGNLSLNFYGGNVGVGGTNPTARFEVTGSGSTSGATAHFLNSIGTSLLFVRDNGTVGIGSTIPTVKLDVSGTIRTGGPGLNGKIIFTRPTDGLNIGQIFNSGSSGQGLTLEAGGGSSFISFNAGTGGLDGSNPERVRIDGTTGNVGIGTNSPSYTIDARAPSNADTILRLVKTASTSTTMQAVGGALAFGVDTGAGTTERARIDTNGNVGIGTSSFTARLFVSGSTTSSTSTMIIREGVTSATGGAEVLDVQNSAGTSLMYVSGSGEIGIGTISSMMTSTVTTTSTSTTTLMSIPSSTFRSAEFVVQGVDATGGKYHSVKIIAVHNGTTATHTEYGAVNVGGIAGTLDVTDPSGGTFLLQVTSASTNSTVWKVTAILTKA